MGKKSKKDPEKKAALQAKKEAKANKAAQKRLQKESGAAAVQEEDQLDALLARYKQSDVATTTTRIETLSEPPAPRANASFTLADDTKKGTIYMFGGEYYDGIENIVLNHLIKYDWREWKQLHVPPPIPPPRCAHSAVYYNKAIYIFGGEMAAADSYYHYKDVWKFDIKESKWEELRPAKTGTAPSARSGHAAVVWKHFMIIFGGFYEAAKDAPRWFNDVSVLNLQTLQWMNIPHSKLTQRPEPRSACNAAVMEDRMIIHGGFSKLVTSKASSRENDDDERSSRSEIKVHTDAWILHLKPLLQDKPPTWERLIGSAGRSQLGFTNNSNNDAATIGTPNGRSGTAAVQYKDRMLVFGGVVDKEQYHYKMDSIFYNDLFGLDMERRRWFPINLRKNTCGETTKRRRRKKGEAQGESQEEIVADAENSDTDLEDDHEDHDTATTQKGWDLGKLRSNMFAFIDGQGNVVYEKIEEEEGDVEEANDSDEEREEEKEDESDQEEKADESDEEEKEDEREEEKESEDECGSNGERKAEEMNVKCNAVAGKEPSRRKVKAITSSSVMTLNTETNLPEAVVRDEPLPRIQASLAVVGHTLYVYGGVLEVGDREITLDDFWCLDLRKREKWDCLWPGTMHRQVWRGAQHDDDDSYYSADRTAGDNVGSDLDDDGDSIAEEKSQSEKEEEKVDLSSKKKKKSTKEQIAELIEKYDLDNLSRTPQRGEALSEFYSRTSDYWNGQVVNNVSVDQPRLQFSSKELKREGFSLAQVRFEELEEVLDRLNELQLKRQAKKERRKDEKAEKKDKKSTH